MEVKTEEAKKIEVQENKISHKIGCKYDITLHSMQLFCHRGWYFFSLCPINPSYAGTAQETSVKQRDNSIIFIIALVSNNGPSPWLYLDGWGHSQIPEKRSILGC